MDNLPAHKGARVEQLIKSAGAELRYVCDTFPLGACPNNPFLEEFVQYTVASLPQ